MLCYMKKKNLIDELDEYRLDRRITQAELAEMLEVAFVTVNRWFNGHTQPNKIQEFQIRKLLAGKGGKR